MIITLKQIQCLAQDIRLNNLDDAQIKEYKLRQIEDICIKAIIAWNERQNGNN